MRLFLLRVTAGTNATVAPLPLPTTARVVDADGVAVPSVEVVLHERVSDRKYVLSSDAQGAFALDMPPGVYDIGLNSSLDPNSATCFYGPLTLPAQAGRTFVLQDGGGRPAGTIFGRIELQAGRPASFCQVVLSPTQTSSTADPQNPIPVPPPVQVQTLADGSFQTTLAADGPVALDLEVYGADGTLDEFVDVSTLSKPCYVEFAVEESPVMNRLRSHQTDAPGSAVQARAGELRPKLVTQFTPYYLLDNRTALVGGVLTGDPDNDVVQYRFPDIANGPIDSKLSNNLISVALNGSWWNQFAVNVYSSESGVGGRYSFTDYSNKTHVLQFGKTLTVFHGISILGFGKLPSVTMPMLPGWHKISYSSNQPNIGLIYAQPQP